VAVAPTWISFDPGKRTGVAAWNDKGGCKGKTEYLEDDLIFYLRFQMKASRNSDYGKPKAIIYEPFRVRPDKALKFAGSVHEEIQVIGMIKLFAAELEVPLVESSPNNLKIAAMWSGTKIPAKGHIANPVSAFLHGYHYLHTIGVIPPRVLENYK
jgi:hypothetical protein